MRCIRRGGRSRARGGVRGRSRPWDSRRGVSTPGRWSRGSAGPKAIVDSRGAAPAAVAVRRRVWVEMRSEDGFAVGGTGEPDEAGADAVRPVVSTELVPCVGLLEGVGWATAVAATGVSAEPVPCRPQWVRRRPKRNRCRLQAKPARRRGSDRRWRRMQKHERRISPKE